MMVLLATHNARTSKTIKALYRPHIDLFQLDEYASLEEAIGTGAVVPLPAEPQTFNLKPRVDGKSPIGEKDLDNQGSYIAARPAAVGALLDVAARVTSGAVEVTSLVRHSEYQRSLRQTNRNAVTTVPMHTLGLAFDISLINTPLPTVYEIRDVLRRMQATGDLLFIGERRQLVFHVVPHPRRLGHFEQVYARALAASMPNANVIAAPAGDPRRGGVPTVTSEVSVVHPTEEIAEEWWASEAATGDLAVLVMPSPPTMEADTPSVPLGPLALGLVLVAGALVAGFRYLG